MKSSWAAIVAAVCVAIALVVVVRIWSADTEPEATPQEQRASRVATRRAERGTASGFASGEERERRADRRGGREEGRRGTDYSARDDRGGSSRDTDSRDESSRSRLAPAIGSAPNRMAARDGSGSGARAQGREGSGIALPPGRGRDGTEEHLRPDLPEATGQNVQDAAAEEAEEAPQVNPTPVPGEIKEVAYDGGADHVFDTAHRMEVPDAGRISAQSGTVAFWIQPEWQSDDQNSADLVQLGDTGLSIVKEGSFIRFQYTDAQGNQQGGDADIGAWHEREWHHVAAVWTGSSMELYVDGGQAFLNQGGTRSAVPGTTRLSLGSSLPPDSTVALGQMSYLTVLNRNATSDDIRHMVDTTGPR